MGNLQSQEETSTKLLRNTGVLFEYGDEIARAPAIYSGEIDYA